MPRKKEEGRKKKEGIREKNDNSQYIPPSWEQ